MFLGQTYTRELDAAVTALGGGAPLLEVQVPVLTTGGPDNADLVGDRVVPEHDHVSLQLFTFPLLPSAYIRRSNVTISCEVSAIDFRIRRSGLRSWERLTAGVSSVRTMSAFHSSMESRVGKTYVGESVSRHLDGISLGENGWVGRESLVAVVGEVAAGRDCVGNFGFPPSTLSRSVRISRARAASPLRADEGGTSARVRASLLAFVRA